MCQALFKHFTKINSLNSKAILCVRDHCYPHMQMRKLRERLYNIPKVPQLSSGEAGIQTQALWLYHKGHTTTNWWGKVLNVRPPVIAHREWGKYGPWLGHALQRNSEPCPDVCCSIGHEIHGAEGWTLLETHFCSSSTMHTLPTQTTLNLKSGQKQLCRVVDWVSTSRLRQPLSPPRNRTEKGLQKEGGGLVWRPSRSQWPSPSVFCAGLYDNWIFSIKTCSCRLLWRCTFFKTEEKEIFYLIIYLTSFVIDNFQIFRRKSFVPPLSPLIQNAYKYRE